MREYTLFCIGSDGQVEKRHNVHANDDLGALDQARMLCHEHEIEIWQRGQIITRVAKDGAASWKLSPSSRCVSA